MLVAGAAGTPVLTALAGLAWAARARRRVARLERLMPPSAVHATTRQVVKPTPPELLVDRGTGADYETRLGTLDGYTSPNDRFFVRSHSPTPRIDAASWRLRLEGTGLRRPLTLDYEALRSMPQTTVVRTIECAGNGRHMFKEVFGVSADGAQYRMGMIGVAEWRGVRLRDLLERAGVTRAARDVMPEGLDDRRMRRPMPLAKALEDDTLLALEMNGETLPADHGFPARVVVSGWIGAACTKWVGRIEVSEEPLRSPWNTVEYVLVGPHYRARLPALGPVVTEAPVRSVLDLDWPAELPAGPTIVHGRASAGESRVREVTYRIDDGPWRAAELFGPRHDRAWVRWRFRWEATPGTHAIRTRATDERGRSQPESVPWNHYGYSYNAVAAHPVVVR